jgi:hypothetical protein
MQDTLHFRDDMKVLQVPRAVCKLLTKNVAIARKSF